MSRRGFTLIELLVAMMLALLVGGIVHGLMAGGQRLARAQAERMAVQENVRAAATVLTAELGAVGYDEVTAAAAAALGYPIGIRSDLLDVDPGAVTYLSERVAGRLCAIEAGLPARVVVEAASWESPRAPRAGDSLLVFAESDPLTAADDAWLHLGVTSVSAASCPDGAGGLAIPVTAPPPLLPTALTTITPGAPVRLAEVMQMRYYRSGGESWFGMRSVSTGEAITPVAGPLADSSARVRGLTMIYRDAVGAETSIPADVRSIEISLVGITSRPIHWRDPGWALVDSFALGTRVALRNALRP